MIIFLNQLPIGITPEFPTAQSVIATMCFFYVGTYLRKNILCIERMIQKVSYGYSID